MKDKIEFFTHTQIDSIPKENRYNSMLNRKTLPGGKQLPKTVADQALRGNVGASQNNIVFKQSHSPGENGGDLQSMKKQQTTKGSPGRTSPTVSYLPYNYQQQAHYIKGHQAQHALNAANANSDDLLVVMPNHNILYE